MPTRVDGGKKTEVNKRAAAAEAPNDVERAMVPETPESDERVNRRRDPRSGCVPKLEENRRA